jgi:hypothetical protein
VSQLPERQMLMIPISESPTNISLLQNKILVARIHQHYSKLLSPTCGDICQLCNLKATKSEYKIPTEFQWFSTDGVKWHKTWNASHDTIKA